MKSQDDMCSHCGNIGSIKFLYLGLETKVKNWFRSRELSKKKCWHLGYKGTTGWEFLKITT